MLLDACILDWDSAFWGYPVIDVHAPFVDDCVDDLNVLVRSSNARLIQLSCPARDVGTIMTAERVGFHLVNVRITLTSECIQMSDIYDAKHASLSCAAGIITYSNASTDDTRGLLSLVDGMYEHSRYMVDPMFDHDRAQHLYHEWIKNSIVGTFDDICMCMYLDGALCGFYTFRMLGGSSSRIGLFGVSSRLQGFGLGRMLAEHAKRYAGSLGCASIGVLTQGANVSAIRTYQRAGYVVSDVGLMYHMWRT